jgi:hypothetical protein
VRRETREPSIETSHVFLPLERPFGLIILGNDTRSPNCGLAGRDKTFVSRQAGHFTLCRAILAFGAWETLHTVKR